MKTDLSSLTFKRKIQRKVSRQCKKDIDPRLGLKK